MAPKLTRTELAARIATLSDVLDRLWDTTAMTSGDPFLCLGRVKMELIALEAELRDRDRQSPPLPLPVALAMVGRFGRCERCGKGAELLGGICGSCGDDLRQDADATALEAR